MYRSLNTLGHQTIRSHCPAAYHVVDIRADNQTRTATDPRPQDLHNPSPTTAVTVRTDLSQGGKTMKQQARPSNRRACASADLIAAASSSPSGNAGRCD